MNELKTSVSARVAQLRSLPIKEVWVLWDRYFPRRPDKPNREYLQSRLASKIKERRKPRDIYLAPGTVLMRQWGERDHKVTVSAEGTFEYEGRFFKSLSSVARHIAGTPWSGPLFFGLRRNEEVCE